MKAPALLGGASMVFLLIASACDGAKEPPFLPETSPTATVGATPTVAPSPTVTAETPAEAPGLEGFRKFAASIDAALAGGDASFFADRGVEEKMICAGDEQLGPCVEQPAGASVQGIPFGRWRSEGTLLPMEDFRTDLADYLVRGNPSLHAIGILVPGSLVEGSAFFAVVASPDDPATTRVVAFVFTDGSWRMPFVMEAPVLSEEWLSGDCGECYDQWEQWEGAP